MARARCPARSSRLSLEDLELLVAKPHDLIFVVGVLVVDVSARNEDTYEERVTLARYKTDMEPRQGIAMIARTVARRLRRFCRSVAGSRVCGAVDRSA